MAGDLPYDGLYVGALASNCFSSPTYEDQLSCQALAYFNAAVAWQNWAMTALDECDPTPPYEE